MLPHLRYLSYVLRHKWYVLWAGLWLGVPLWRLLIHDWSKFSRTADFDKLKANPGGFELEPEKLSLDGIEREFMLSILAFDPQTRQIKVELGVRTAGDAAVQRRVFNVGVYDFPMIDNTRLSKDQRAALVINQVNNAGADLTLVYFPGSYASLKEKVSYDEVVEKLRGLGQR